MTKKKYLPKPAKTPAPARERRLMRHPEAAPGLSHLELFGRDEPDDEMWCPESCVEFGCVPVVPD